jgi:hypothetical protein
MPLTAPRRNLRAALDDRRLHATQFADAPETSTNPLSADVKAPAASSAAFSRLAC